jgi:hypothetical protein
MLKKLSRGEVSFLLIWVINPIVVLFFQNCSSQAQLHTQEQASKISISQEKE